jgi:hypothetical protein
MIIKRNINRLAKHPELTYEELKASTHHRGSIAQLLDYGTSADGPAHKALAHRAYNRLATGVIAEINKAAKA